MEENYPLPEKPELLPGFRLVFLYDFHLFIYCEFNRSSVIGEDGVKELQRKRHSATPGVSVKGRVRKVAKWQPPSDAESDEESDSESLRNKF